MWMAIRTNEMGLILGIILIIIGFIGSLFIGFANGMASAPSASNSISIWPWLIGCCLLGAILIFTHYHSISW